MRSFLTIKGRTIGSDDASFGDKFWLKIIKPTAMWKTLFRLLENSFNTMT